MGKLVCPWGLGWIGPIETAPSNEFGGATRRRAIPDYTHVEALRMADVIWS